MQPIDVQQEFNRLSQLYRNMRDEELEDVAAQAYDLTDIAREALSFEISSRGLKIPLNLTPPTEAEPEPFAPEDDGFVPDNDDLTPIFIANDMEELLRVKALLTQGGFECFLGDAKVRDPQMLRENFADGVEILVWKEQSQRAMGYMHYNMPGDDQPDRDPKESEIRCPKCKSDGVIFEERDIEATAGTLVRSSRFRWRCDDCRHEWEDDGVVRG